MKTAAIKGQTGTATYLVAVFNSGDVQTMRFEQTLPGVRAWLDGVELANGDRVKVGKGLCQLLLQERGVDFSARICEKGCAPRHPRHEELAGHHGYGAGQTRRLAGRAWGDGLPALQTVSVAEMLTFGLTP